MNQHFARFSFVLAHPRFWRGGRKWVENRIIQRRVERAQGLIEIALKCGLADQAQFTKRLSQHRGRKSEHGCAHQATQPSRLRQREPAHRPQGRAAAGTSQSVGSDSGAHSWC